MDLGEDIEAAKGAIITNIVNTLLCSEARSGASSSSIVVALHHAARTVSVYSYHLSLAMPSLVLVSSGSACLVSDWC